MAFLGDEGRMARVPEAAGELRVGALGREGGGLQAMADAREVRYTTRVRGGHR